MSQEFKIGSIADLVDKSGTKISKKKKKTALVSSESLIVSQVESTTITESLKRKVVTEEFVPKKTKKSKTVKKQKLQVDNIEPENEPETPATEDNLTQDDPVHNNQKKNKKKQKKVTAESQTDKLARTIFVGNLPASFHLKDLKKKLSEFGKVLSIRVRSVAPAKATLSKKAAFLSKQINENKKTVNAYVVFKEASSVTKAIQLNGTIFENNHIQVDIVEENPSYDYSMSLFLGNLSFKANEEQIREFFQDCGEIKKVRMIRDSKTGMGKGFGFVTFASKDSLVLGLEKNGQLLNGREVRIKSYKNSSQPNENKGSNKRGRKLQKPTKAKKAKMSEDDEDSQKSPSKGKKPKKVSPKVEFKGQMAVKKRLKSKTSLKDKVKSSKIKKEKKKVSEILTK